MKTTIDELSSQEIRERLNSWNLNDHRPMDDYMERLYMEDGHHYEGSYPSIISLLRKEAEKRGIACIAASELSVGATFDTVDGTAEVTEIHPDPNGWGEMHTPDYVFSFPFKRTFRPVQIYLAGK
jgi:hypothetical protein